MVEVSAKNNINLDSLLEIIALTAEVGELKAQWTGDAAGVVIESHIEPYKGSVATMLVQKGVLRVQDALASGTCGGRVKMMTNEAGTSVKEAVPSTAVQVFGFDEPPQAGDQFQVYSDIVKAKEVIAQRQKEDTKRQVGFTGLSTESDQTMKLALILKTDAQGSIAAVKHMFSDVKDSKYVNLRWVMASVGVISDSDVQLASTCPEGQRAMILGFNTEIAPSAAKLAKDKGVTINNFKVIYELFETVVSALESDLEQEEKLIQRGFAVVKAVFKGVGGNVAGCEVVEGQLVSGERIKVFRDDREIAQGKLKTLRRFKDMVDDVDEGQECGFGIEGWDAWEPGDEARCFQVSLYAPQVVKR